MNETYTGYCISWSPKTGEATYTRIFHSADERAAFIQRIDAKSVHTWENTYTR